MMGVKDKIHQYDYDKKVLTTQLVSTKRTMTSDLDSLNPQKTTTCANGNQGVCFLVLGQNKWPDKVWYFSTSS